MAEISRAQRTLSELLTRPEPGSTLTPAALAKLFKPLIAYSRKSREAKRKTLTTLTVEIVVAKYEVSGMFIGSTETTRLWVTLRTKGSGYP